jgi:hypothetical protein
MDIYEIAANTYGITPFPEKTVYAMAYVPFQQPCKNTYSPEIGLQTGTLFPSLDKPFIGCGGIEDDREG